MRPIWRPMKPPFCASPENPASLAAIRTRLASNREQLAAVRYGKIHPQSRSGIHDHGGAQPARRTCREFCSRRSQTHTARRSAIPDAAAAAFLQGCKLVRENDLAGALPWFDRGSLHRAGFCRSPDQSRRRSGRAGPACRCDRRTRSRRRRQSLNGRRVEQSRKCVVGARPV